MNQQQASLQAYWDRESKQVILNENYAGSALSWMYGSALGKIFLYGYFSTRVHSWVYRQYKRSRWTRSHALEDIQKYKINLDEFQIDPEEIHCYRDFFLRKFKPQKRVFVDSEDTIASFAEGQYLGYEHTHSEIRFPVKGSDLSAEQILEKPEVSKRFAGGPVLICRLSPIDYHWFHFPVSGDMEESYYRKGTLHAVNLVALQHKSNVYCTNERQISILNTEHLGSLAFVEVGAMGVGRIIQEFHGKQFERGQLKGYFDFGASTIIVFGEKGRWSPSEDILKQTTLGRETRIHLGQAVATKRR